MQTDNNPPITLPGGGSLTLPSMSGGSTQPTPQSTTATTTQPVSRMSDFSTPSGEWSVAAFVALFIVVILLVVVKVFFSGSWADHVSDGAEEALGGRWTPFIALILLILFFTIGLGLTGTKLW